ncbi:MAG TPA: ribosomal RNA small subunit methyltransferase A [Saprospiraceae bacterium]|nr:ribosomal RNA small subunit methyltransferase A [Saprospiraceae bacterium]
MKAKKRFGQHFLVNEEIAENIALSVSVPSGNLLEVGPGKGVMTKYLRKQDVNLKVVELDNDMIPILKSNFVGLDIIHADFLKLEQEAIFGHSPFTIIGNFPYNISSQILFRMLDWKESVPELVGMFQKEVAKRVVSGPGNKDYGVTSVLVQAYYEGEYLFSVEPGNFSPPPRVQSGVIRLTRKADYGLPCDDKTFKRLVKLTFSQRRKMIRNTLRAELSAQILTDDFFRQRPEQLSVEDFIKLTNLITQSKNNKNEPK